MYPNSLLSGRFGEPYRRPGISASVIEFVLIVIGDKCPHLNTDRQKTKLFQGSPTMSQTVGRIILALVMFVKTIK